MTHTELNAKANSLLEQALALTAEQREWLANCLIDSLAQDPDYYPGWHRKAVREAIEEYDANPDSAISLEEHRRRALQALEAFRAGRS